MRGHIVPLFTFTIVTTLCFSCNGQTAGKYDVSLKEVMRCANSGTNEISFASTKLTKLSRHSYNYQSNFSLAITLDDYISMVSEVQSWGNGGWRPAWFTLDLPHFCSGCKKVNPKWFQEMIKNTGRDDCPIPPGTYEINARNTSFIEFTIPLSNSGNFRLMNQFYNQDVLIGCIGMVVEVTPKRKQSKRN